MDMIEQAEVLGEVEASLPNVARIYDFVLGGKDSYGGDRREANGQWLRQLRRARGWSGAEMARKLREAATSAGDTLPSRKVLLVMIRRWEEGGSGVSERYRLHYCRAFQIPADWFGNPAALDSRHSGSAGPSGGCQAAAKHATTWPSLTSGPGGPAGQLRYARNQMHAAVDQLCHPEDRDQFCFLLGYVSALLTAIPPAQDDGSAADVGH